MSHDVNWDVDRYRDDHESEDHWKLRKAFMERWKDDYPEERLVCLARVFTNIELMGCRYPTEVMQEVSRLSHEVAKSYRNERKTKLQRTFVSASDAAEDRAKGIKRKGGIVIEEPPPKSSKIAFVKQGQSNDNDSDNDNDIQVNDANVLKETDIVAEVDKEEDKSLEKKSSEVLDANDYVNEMMKLDCLNVTSFRENMFQSMFGRLVLLIRPWASKLWNIQASCQACNMNLSSTFENRCFSVTLNGKLLAQATGETKIEAKSMVEMMAWERLRKEVVSVLVKEQWIAQGDARISVSDVSGNQSGNKSADVFGTPVENTVAMKMMQMMGWKGGGLGADAQGIAEPIKPNLQMVNRAGLGSTASDIRQLRRAAHGLMQRYIASDTFDLDLVFSSEFSKEERALLHQCAQKAGLASRSYGDKDRFLVVKKKLDPFSLVRAVIEKGGNTPKYQVFIPAALDRRNGR